MYRTPFRIIDANALPAEVAALRPALNLEKKKMLAEFELAGTVSITYKGQELHRQDVLSLFDELNQPLLLGFHKAIWNDQVLLLFLEEARLLADHNWASNSLYRDFAFLQFVSPYYSASCNLLIQGVLNETRSLDEYDTLLRNELLMLASDTEQAFRYASRFFLEKKNELLVLRHRADLGQSVKVNAIREVFNDEQVFVLNRLPDGFTALRYEIANILNNLCVAFDRKNANKEALVAIERAATIRHDDEELSRLVPSNLRIIRSKRNKGFFNINPDTGKRTPKIGWIITLFVVIIRLASAGGCEDHPVRLSDYPVVFHDSGAMNALDSKIFKLDDSVSRALYELDSVVKYQAKYRNPLIGKKHAIRKQPSDSTIILENNKAVNDTAIILEPR